MTVAELIAKLSELPQDFRVVVGGFDEWDYTDPVVSTHAIAFDKRPRGNHQGPHDMLTHGQPNAVLIDHS